MSQQPTAPAFTIFGRDPMLITGLISSAVMLAVALGAPLSVDQQGVINAAAVAILGLIGALSLGGEKVAAAVLQLFKVLIALGVAFGLKWSPEVQGAVMVFATAAIDMFTRTQVVARVPASA